jgi:SAM-dependent methyltransferase
MADVPEGKVDIALLYDVLHDFSEPRPILMALHRILKADGILSVADHHLKQSALLSMITGGGLFIPAGTSRRTFQFVKAAASISEPE